MRLESTTEGTELDDKKPAGVSVEMKGEDRDCSLALTGVRLLATMKAGWTMVNGRLMGC